MKAPSGNRRRRVRCKNCDACLGGDCRVCVYCKDMAKYDMAGIKTYNLANNLSTFVHRYGGPGRLKQTCEKRRCLHPQLPICAFCSVCELDGFVEQIKRAAKFSQEQNANPFSLQLEQCPSGRKERGRAA